MLKPPPMASVVVSPPGPQEIPVLPHFSQSMPWRMITTLLWMLIMACAAGVLWRYGKGASEHFLGKDSLEGIWQEAFPLVMLAGPMAVVMLAGGLDLSVGAVAILASVITVSALNDGKSPADAFVLAMLVSGGIGLTHALLVGLVAINPVVLTLVSAFLIQSYAMLNAIEQPSIDQGTGFLESLHTMPLLLGISAGVSLLLIQLAQIGGGPRPEPVTGQPWYRRTFFTSLPYVLSSLAAGAVGCALAGQYPRATPDPNKDLPMALMVIFAAMIGGNCTGRRFGTVIGAIAGAVILGALRYLMIMEATPLDTIIMIIASAAGSALLLSQLTYWIVNLFYRKSRRRAA